MIIYLQERQGNEMFIPYPDTKKELFFDTDYVKVRDIINQIKLADFPGVIENLMAALDDAVSYHADLLQNNIYSDICALKKWYIIRVISCSSSGTIASYIGKSKYREIDKAVNNTIIYYSDIAKHDELFNMRTDPEGIKEAVQRCYKMNIPV